MSPEGEWVGWAWGGRALAGSCRELATCRCVRVCVRACLRTCRGVCVHACLHTHVCPCAANTCTT